MFSANCQNSIDNDASDLLFATRVGFSVVTYHTKGLKKHAVSPLTPAASNNFYAHACSQTRVAYFQAPGLSSPGSFVIRVHNTSGGGTEETVNQPTWTISTNNYVGMVMSQDSEKIFVWTTDTISTNPSEAFILHWNSGTSEWDVQTNPTSLVYCISKATYSKTSGTQYLLVAGITNGADNGYACSVYNAGSSYSVQGQQRQATASTQQCWAGDFSTDDTRVVWASITQTTAEVQLIGSIGTNSFTRTNAWFGTDWPFHNVIFLSDSTWTTAGDGAALICCTDGENERVRVNWADINDTGVPSAWIQSDAANSVFWIQDHALATNAFAGISASRDGNWFVGTVKDNQHDAFAPIAALHPIANNRWQHTSYRTTSELCQFLPGDTTWNALGETTGGSQTPPHNMTGGLIVSAGTGTYMPAVAFAV